jgi:isopentenyldiphosphate isomerase
MRPVSRRDDSRGDEVAREEDELLEVVDDYGRVVGREPRARCHADPALRHRAVHVLVRNSSGQWFLQKRSPTRRVQPGRWDSAVGGHVRPGEGWEEAALRELREELGLKLASPDALVRLHDYVWRSEVETECVRTYLLEAEGPFEPHPDEIEEGRFWTEDELRSAAGAGVLTPNLEEELRQVGAL